MGTHNDEGDIEVFFVHFDNFPFMLGRFLLVHRVWFEVDVVGLNRLDGRSGGVTFAISGRRHKRCKTLNAPLQISSQRQEDLVFVCGDWMWLVDGER